jgi:hypothetical protein
MTSLVETVFRKAQNEADYCIFYGELCEQFTKLELSLRGLATKVKTLKHSDFRTALIDYCRSSFNQFFNSDKFKGVGDEDKLKM